MIHESHRRLISADPLKAIDEALREIVDKTNAATAGLFLADREPILQAGSLNQAALTRVAETWARHHAVLRQGRPHAGDDYQVWPLDPLPSGLPLVYIGGKGPLRLAPSRSAVSDAADVLACALGENGLTAAELATIDRYLANATPDEVLKRQLRVRLDKEGGRIARVAKGMGMSRTTMYEWMDRYGIPRQP